MFAMPQDKKHIITIRNDSVTVPCERTNSSNNRNSNSVFERSTVGWVGPLQLTSLTRSNQDVALAPTLVIICGIAGI